ncbi:MAG TPA: hypothetical protein VJ865_07440, partial [Gemmatimonadaceae bacterium]|nr:hypothetical protein [Gemmatimonadaceae bacterium]
MSFLLLLFLSLGQQPDSSERQLIAIDSLYAARDTSALVRSLRAWDGESIPRIQLYRGITALWTGRTTQAISILRPLLDSAKTALTNDQRREAIRALAESYARKRQYANAAGLYDAELKSVDAQLDSLS